MSDPRIHFRPYQEPVFWNRSSGIQILFWSRQIGKSFTMACWIVDRMLTCPGRLIVVLSNSRDNGAELNQKVADVCDLLGQVVEQKDLSGDLKYENMNMESRITVGGKISRVKVLAANPRTARGFSGDLIMDEFAFQENGQKIWEAAEPILSSNPDFLCRIASTPNGTRNMFYLMTTSNLYEISKVRRSDAWKQGLKIYHPTTRKPITPEQARALAIDKKAYDQNYELIWADENTTLLTYELIGLAEQDGVGLICEQDWSADALARLRAIETNLYFGLDVGRSRDISVLTAMEKVGQNYFARAILRMSGMRLPRQQERLDVLCRLPALRRGCIDMTGIGLGLCEYAQEKHGMQRIQGVNFASSEPMNAKLAAAGRKGESVRVTESMATDLLEVYESKAIKHPYDIMLRDDLRLPERVVSSNGRVSIAASRDGAATHADHFWSFALAVRAAKTMMNPGTILRLRSESRRGRALAARRERSLVG